MYKTYNPHIGSSKSCREARRFSGGLLYRLGCAAPRPAAGAGDAVRRRAGLQRQRGANASRGAEVGHFIGIFIGI